MNKLLIAAALIAAAPIAANAADLPTHKSAPEPYVAPVAYNWTGFYAGVQIGAVATDGTFGELYDEDESYNTKVSLTQVTAGGSVGYDYQLNNFVIGAVGDLDARFGTGSVSYYLNVNSDWDASLRARVGYLVTDRALAYVTGGVAFANYTNSYSYYDEGESIPNFFGGNRVGGTVGAGVEYKLDKNWRLKAEYLYADYGSHSLSYEDEYTYKTKIHSDAVRFGLNYQFN